MGTRARNLKPMHFCAGLKSQNLCFWYQLPLPSLVSGQLRGPGTAVCPSSPGRCPQTPSTRGRKVPVTGLHLSPPDLGSLPLEHIAHLCPHLLPHFLPLPLSVGISDSRLLPGVYFLARPGCRLHPTCQKATCRVPFTQPSGLSCCRAALLCRTTTWG